MYDYSYMILVGGIMLISQLVSFRLKSKFTKYSALHLQNNMSGAEIATKMLHDNGIFDVKVVSVPGQLTDHYNPANKTVNLSEAVFNERNAAAAAVAAHECGHAVQHATSYSWLTMRSKIVPMVSIASRFSNILIMIGIAIMASSAIGATIFKIGVGLFAVTVFFSVITLPVEFDASKRALAWLQKTHTVTDTEYAGAQDALKWAAMTYVVAALGAIAQLLYFLSRMNNRD